MAADGADIGFDYADGDFYMSFLREVSLEAVRDESTSRAGNLHQGSATAEPRLFPRDHGSQH
jgi:hypothetical protein